MENSYCYSLASKPLIFFSNETYYALDMPSINLNTFLEFCCFEITIYDFFFKNKSLEHAPETNEVFSQKRKIKRNIERSTPVEINVRKMITLLTVEKTHGKTDVRINSPYLTA